MCESVTKQPIALKTCPCCTHAKELDCFYFSKATPSGRQSLCKECSSKKQKDRRSENVTPYPVTVTDKVCRNCKKNKASDSFYVKGDSKDGLQPWCKECCTNHLGEWRENNLELVRELSNASRRKTRIEDGDRIRAQDREDYASHPLQQRQYRLKTKWGMTPEQFESKTKDQGGGCAICELVDVNKVLNIDHNHITGELRGLLCVGCNTGIGHFKENGVLLAAAQRYLVESKKLGKDFLGREVFSPDLIKGSRRVRRNLGVSKERYGELLLLQNGRCAICNIISPSPLNLDHEHSSGRTRGLLCKSCNFGLGNFKDSPEAIESAIVYLIKYQKVVK